MEFCALSKKHPQGAGCLCASASSLAPPVPIGLFLRNQRCVGDLDRNQLTISETRGFLKMLIDEHGNRILGFTAFITGGGDLIAVVQMAMLSGVKFPALRDAIFTHPTIPEGLNVLLSDIEVRQPEMRRMPARS